MDLSKLLKPIFLIATLVVAACDSGGSSRSADVTNNELTVTRIDIRATSDVDNALVDVEVVDLQVATITVDGG